MLDRAKARFFLVFLKTSQTIGSEKVQLDFETLKIKWRIGGGNVSDRRHAERVIICDDMYRRSPSCFTNRPL